MSSHNYNFLIKLMESLGPQFSTNLVSLVLRSGPMSVIYFSKLRELLNLVQLGMFQWERHYQKTVYI